MTSTNLLFNVIGGPGALRRYHRAGVLCGGVTRRPVAGALPGVVLGAAVRVCAFPGPETFRLLIAALLLPLGVWLCIRTLAPAAHPLPGARPELSPAVLTAFVFVVGVAGGVYGIGGGSLVGSVLAARGVSLARVAPAALATTFATSVIGAVVYSCWRWPVWGMSCLTGRSGLPGVWAVWSAAVWVPVSSPACPRPSCVCFWGCWPQLLAGSTLSRRSRETNRRGPSGSLPVGSRRPFAHLLHLLGGAPAVVLGGSWGCRLAVCRPQRP
ncbi:TSUP family transporter [Streptomyces thermospinosisporus]|uniref:TSUP family transporter n=1 Tax=Streptomyces thermospinosisporus TaxID=161482 RepID=UPI003CD053C2